MKNNTTIQKILQEVIEEKEIFAKNNREKRRKLTKEYKRVIAAIDSTRVVVAGSKFTLFMLTSMDWKRH